MQCVFHDDITTGNNQAPVQGYCQVMHIDVGPGKKNCSAYVDMNADI